VEANRIFKTIGPVNAERNIIMKKIYIVTADDIILYQPTILNLYDLLSSNFDVTIISFEPAYLGKKKELTRKVTYIQPHRWALKFFKTVDLFSNAILKRSTKLFTNRNYRIRTVRKYKAYLLYQQLKSIVTHTIIAVDPMPFVLAQKLKNNICFLSLEIIPDDPYIKKMDFSKISAIIIQNQLRYNFFCKTIQPRVFYIQNAPMRKHKIEKKDGRKDLLWAGTIAKEFAVIDCIEFIKQHTEYKLVLKGANSNHTKEFIEANYQDLILSNHLEINTTYLEAEDFIKFVSTFRIGFCFYNWNLIRSNFNYETAPSGKLFMYLAAGVPVIACNISGFSFISDFNAGILIDDYSPESILKAILQIEANYSYYSSNAYKAFEATCFDKNTDSLLDYFLEIS
jgi:glycosyltransferase involved in cell wall biosynthesis